MESATVNAPQGTAPVLGYRVEIDGLRAVAVMAVVLFHARLGCPGGYVGVDVFFVISGFLITSLILRDLDASKFSMLDFWERRVRRIAPALTVWVAVTLAAGWFLYLPEDFARLGQAVVAQGLVLSNVYHGWKIDYFTPKTDAFPLLHTWSLAVEEQFYIVLPLILVGIRKWRPAWLRPLLWIACAASFVLAVCLTKTYPRISFWVLPTRAWELLLGSLLAAYPQLGSSASHRVREVVGWGGLAAIFVSIGVYDEQVPFPGVATLLPTLGTVAFIWANRALTSTGRVLSWSPIVFIGKVSYSFYLIHWPVIAYADYWFRDEMPWTIRLCLMDAAFLLAVLSYYVVETPFRKGQILSLRRPLFVSALGFTILLMAVGFLVHQNGGVRSRFDAQTLAYIPPERQSVGVASQSSIQAVENGQLFKFGASASDATCLVWGDSHAMVLIPVLGDLCLENCMHGTAAMYANTPPLLGFIGQNRLGLGADAPRFNSAVLKIALEPRVRVVVLSAFWSQYAQHPDFGPCLENTVQQLTEAGKTVVLVRDVPTQPGHVPRLLVRAQAFGESVQTVGVPVAAHREKNREADQWLEQLAGPNVIVVDPTPFLTDETGLCRAELNGVTLYQDTDHVSAVGARRLKPMLDSVFQNLGQPKQHSHSRPPVLVGERPEEPAR